MGFDASAGRGLAVSPSARFDPASNEIVLFDDVTPGLRLLTLELTLVTAVTSAFPGAVWWPTPPIPRPATGDRESGSGCRRCWGLFGRGSTGGPWARCICDMAANTKMQTWERYIRVARRGESTPVWARNQISLPASCGERLFLVAERVPAGKAVKQDGTPLRKGVDEVALCRRELVYDATLATRGIEASAPKIVGHRPLQPWGCNKHPATRWGNNPSLR